MARYDFGGTLPDYVFNQVTVSGQNGLLHLPTGTVNLTFWTTRTGGTQYTGLRLATAPATDTSTITMAADGTIPEFQGPDGVTSMFADAGGTRVRIVTWTPGAGVTGGSGGTVVDASTTTKGIVQLAGDLAGTAAVPTVPGKAPLVHTHTVSQLSDVALAAIRTFLQATTTAGARTAIQAGVDTVMTSTEANTGTDTNPRQITAAILRGAISSYVGGAGSITYAQLPAGTTLTFDYATGGFGAAAGALPTARPTSRTDITVVWTVPVGTDVTAIAIPSDKVDYY